MSRPHPLREPLRQLIAVLDKERQAIAGLELDDITIAAQTKLAVCGAIEKISSDDIDDEIQAMILSARDMNETNRQIRNLVANNIDARIKTLTGSSGLYGRPKLSAVHA